MSEKNPKTSPDPELSPDDLAGADDFQDTAEDPLNQALLEVAQWKDVAHRSAAELDNYRKRMAREMQDSLRYANAGLLESLLPVLDNFDYGMQAAKAESEGSNLYLGLSMVLRQIQDFLKDNHVEEIVAVGSKFDPNLHEAVSQQASDQAAEGVILQQTRKGYKLRDRLLRPASVIVSSGSAPTDAAAQ
ncbi:MAG: nucleotide exchange factor GrpE [Verrucomicrobiota bacterium]